MAAGSPDSWSAGIVDRGAAYQGLCPKEDVSVPGLRGGNIASRGDSAQRSEEQFAVFFLIVFHLSQHYLCIHSLCTSYCFLNYSMVPSVTARIRPILAEFGNQCRVYYQVRNRRNGKPIFVAETPKLGLPTLPRGIIPRESKSLSG